MSFRWSWPWSWDIRFWPPPRCPCLRASSPAPASSNIRGQRTYSFQSHMFSDPFVVDENSPRFKSLVVAIVVLLNIVFYQVISYNQRPSSMTISEENGLRIQYVESVQRTTTHAPSVLDNQPALAATRSDLPEARNDLAETTREDSKPVQAVVMASAPGAPASSNGPLVLELGWTDNTKREPDYRRNILDDRIPASVAMSEPDRFRMRKQISGKDVIEGTAQLLGLWPPGYTTDPCPKIKRNIGGLMSDSRPAARELLNEELRRQQTYCR